MRADFFRRKTLISLISKHAYIEKEVTLSSGKKSNYYVNCKKIFSFPEGTILISDLLWRIVRDYNPDAVGTVGFGAAPLLGVINYFGYRTFIVRKKKDHGISSEIEETIKESDKKVLIIEDVITTGKSVLDAIEKLKKEYPGIEEIKIVCIFDRQEEGTEEIARKGYSFESLSTAKELFRYLRKK